MRASRATALAVHRLNMLPVPTVALVQGGCFGGGTGIVAACDIVIAGDDAMFSIAETLGPDRGDHPAAARRRHWRAPGATLRSDGERFGAEEARRIGLAHEVVPVAELSAAGEKMVGQLLKNAPDANAQTKSAALAFAWGAVEKRWSSAWSRSTPPSAAAAKPPKAWPPSPRTPRALERLESDRQPAAHPSPR